MEKVCVCVFLLSLQREDGEAFSSDPFPRDAGMLVFRIVVVLLCVTVVCSEISRLTDQWMAWKSQHNKSYRNTREERHRRAVWEQNLLEILKHNEETAGGLHTYTLGLNQLSDMDADEVNPLMNGLLEEDLPEVNVSFRPPSHDQRPVPARVDWTEHGMVSPVQNQGRCGSCWAFSAAGALEGQMKRRTGALVPLSPQNLLDCSVSLGNRGCKGGYLSRAFLYVIQNNGIDSNTFYPYEHKEGVCRYSVTGRAGYCSSFRVLPRHDEAALQFAVANIGPVSVGVNAKLPSFHRYRGGIYSEPQCRGLVNHAVLVVGYGSENGLDYWLLKNSWGTAWGEKGFIRMARNKNMCGISSFAIYPTVSDPVRPDP
ncbi:cathepsin S, ortholog 1 isoform X1 [Pimephales promelas]|uniref:cathepsin S, ortholog 1 isoform X1 n=2 Tax=Pimephales promelas TaxID=90988 RepID=UPI001955DAF6|nr:cathepsin S, ortholog 1 isoform X1 [Pimephales promelas]XP_039521840.1 cathepsin S, ortholog 1 isoform X1 [Pimephales promelas]